MSGMNILDGLLGEHVALLTVFEHVEHNAAHMDLERLREAGLLLEHAVMVHSIAEDRYLFDALPDAAASLEPGKAGGLGAVLNAMRTEHKQLARDFDALRAAGTEAAARGCLWRVLEATREHFEVEERVLFRAVADQIGPDKLEELGSAWKHYRMKEALA